MNLFLALFFLWGIIVALCQDLKRREVDNWLNLFLIFGSFSYIVFEGIFGDPKIIFQYALLLSLMFILMNLFYYGRVFGGGDAGLLFAMTAFFVDGNFFECLGNVGLFILLLMVAGSVYGLFYSGVLYLKNLEKVNADIRKNFNRMKFFVCLVSLFGFFIFLFGFFISILFILGFIFIIFPFLFVFAKSLERASMIKEVSGKALREGDWLVRDEKVGSHIVFANWEGLSESEVKILRSKKKVMIKDGLPFVPAFLLAFLSYVFGRYWILGLFGFN